MASVRERNGRFFSEQSGVPDFRTSDADRRSADLDQHGGLMMFLAASEMRQGRPPFTCRAGIRSSQGQLQEHRLIPSLSVLGRTPGSGTQDSRLTDDAPNAGNPCGVGFAPDVSYVVPE